MDIAVVGAGNVGLTLARVWQRDRMHVTVAVRDPEAARHERLRAEFAVGTVAESVREADATLLAIAGAGVPDLLSAQAGALDGCLLLDATNTLGGDQMHQVGLLTKALPAARIYRAFNTLGWENYANPGFDLDDTPVGADMLYCGPKGDDLGQVETLISAAGLRPVRLGDLDAADLLDGITRVWFTLAVGQGHGRHLAFRVLSDG